MRTEINFSSADRQRVMDCARPAILSYCKAKGTKLSDYDYDVIMADSVIKVYKNWNKFDADKASFSTWVGWITRSCACDHYEREGKWGTRHRGFTEKECSSGVIVSEFTDRECSENTRADFKVMSNENLEIIYDICMALGEETGHALILSGQGYSDKEIAKRLGCSDTAIRARLMRGRKKLLQHPFIKALLDRYHSDSAAA